MNKMYKIYLDKHAMRALHKECGYLIAKSCHVKQSFILVYDKDGSALQINKNSVVAIKQFDDSNQPTIKFTIKERNTDVFPYYLLVKSNDSIFDIVYRCNDKAEALNKRDLLISFVGYTQYNIEYGYEKANEEEQHEN